MIALIIISANGQAYINSSQIEANSSPCIAKEGHGWPDKEAKIIDLVIKKGRTLDEGKKIEEPRIILRLRHSKKENQRKWSNHRNSDQLRWA